MAILQLPCKPPLAFQEPADAPGDSVRQPGELRTRRRLHPAEPDRAVTALDIHPVEKQHVNVDVKSENRYCNLIT